MDSERRKINSAFICYLVALLFASLNSCSFSFGLNPNWRLSQSAHSVWRIQDGVFEGTPSAIAQTTDGYIWLGTLMGLFRFDGIRFVRWLAPHGSSLPSSEITALFGGSDGTLWIGTSSGVASWKDGNLVRFPEIDGYIDAILEDENRIVWMVRTRIPASAQGSLCQVSNNKARCLAVTDGISLPWAAALIRDGKDGLWLADDTTLLHWKPGYSEAYNIPKQIAGRGLAGIPAIAEGPDQRLWIGMTKKGSGFGLQQLLQGARKNFVTPEIDGSKLEVNVLKPTRDGALIVGTSGQGLFRIKDGHADHFGAADGLSSDTVENIFEDNEGDLWVATGKGIDCFSDRAVISFSTREGLSADLVTSVLAASDGTIWIGNRNGLDSIKDGKVHSIRTASGFPGTMVTSLFQQPSGMLWVGIDDGLWTYKNGKFRAVARHDGSPTGEILGMSDDFDGGLWAISTRYSKNLLHIQKQKITEEIAIPARGRAAFTTDSRGTVWMGLWQTKVASYLNGRIEMIALSPVPGGHIMDISVDPRRRLLAAVDDRGLIGRRDGKLETLTVENGLPCNDLFNVSQAIDGSLWIGATCGLIRVSKEEIERWWQDPKTRITVRIFDAIDGAEPGRSPFGPSVSRSSDGRLWFANQTSLQMIDPAHLNISLLRPPVHIEEIIANRKQYFPRSGLQLPAHVRDLEIDYTALGFAAPKKITFRYKLEGHDTDWQESGTRRQAFYTDLPPGSYHFHVVARNGTGIWNETGDTIEFSIAPTLYQTLWFRILCVLMLVAALWLFYLVRLKQATAQVQRRLEARLEERERIARDLHDTLLQGFQGLMLRFQAVMKTLPADGSSRRMMEKVMDRADEVLLEGRQSVRNLREISCSQLSDALANCGKELAQDHPALFDLTVSGPHNVLDPVLSNELYLLAREAIFNSFRHSQARTIEVEVIYESAQLSLRVRDDGVGMSQQTVIEGKVGHWGLPGMRERAEKIGGQIKIWSGPNSGTEIEVTIPAQIAYRNYARRNFWDRLKEFSLTLGGKTP